MNNDQTIPVPEKLLKLAIYHLEDGDWGSTAHELRKHLPAPKPRTLADMSPEERVACQWMQATFTKTHYQHVIASVAGNKTRLLRREDGSMFEVPHDEVVPLPDLPRMVWPDEHYPEDGGEEVPLDPTDAQDLADLAEDEYTSPRTVQDLVHHFEGRAESERAVGDTHVGDVWQQAADMLWTALGGSVEK